MKNSEIKKVLFRCSKIGLLAGGLVRNDLTQIQRIKMNELEAAKIKPIGLTDKQQETLDKNDKVIADGGNLTPKQMEQRDDFRSRLTTPKGITPKQQEELEGLVEKDGAEPSLSKGAKTYIKDVWLWYEKGFKEEISSKQTRKGISAENDSINLISFVDNIPYMKNEERITKEHLTGECDVNTYFKEIDKRIIEDLKTSWNPKTFMSQSISTVEEWQGRAYLYLYDADIFRLRRCLVDCPPDVYTDELKRFCWTNNIIDPSAEVYEPLIAQFDANYLYENSGKYTQEERIKTFAIERDEDLEAILLKSIELGIEYYQTITLNMIEL